MNLGENITTYSIANIMTTIFILYSTMFKQIIHEIDSKVCSVYVNMMKSITTKMLTKPLMYKYYCVNISFYLFNYDSFIVLAL
mgnify:FL=1